MKFFGFIVVLLSLYLLVSHSDSALAQRYIKDCAQARSTSDTMTCVKTRLESAQKQLNDLYKKTLTMQTENLQTPLGETQQDWIAYRDAQCAWEAGQAEQGQEKIYEMSCAAILTEQRIAILDTMNEINESAQPREYSSHPRWMNALAEDYPDVLWKYSQWLQADIDCDGEDEQIMSGIAMQGGEDGKPFMRHLQEDQAADSFEGPLYKAEAVVALSENVNSGRSKTTLFRILVGKNEQKIYFCDMPNGMAVIEGASQDAIEGDSEEQAAQSCKRRLEVSDGNCHPAVIAWDGAKYALQKKRIETEEKSDKE